MKIVFCGGGTAGHVSPAIAIAEEMMKDKNTEILFIGREGGRENEAIIRRGFKVEAIKIEGIERRLSLENIKRLLLAKKAIRTSKDYLRDFGADIVVGTGGYVSWPVIKAAKSLNLPTVIHESNASPGLVSRLLSRKCDLVLLNLDGAKNEFKYKENIRVVGNPVSEEFTSITRHTARKKLGLSDSKLLISSFGGSGGSRALNEVIIDIMNTHTSKNKNIVHIHSAGQKYFDEIKKRYPEYTSDKSRCCIKPYIKDMPTLLLASDIVITRCGAMTLSEISAVGTPAIMIPSPNVTGNHQHKNAKLFADGGAGILIEEKDLSERTLLDALRYLENNPRERRLMGEKMRGFSRDNAREIIVKEIKALIK
jgi:UDP-N-acetylglucosamine--N-acetylmuramyl-(pentapeptide) pyrophosphoryl-undecaprenol N-acetylglucosamine transferase